MGKRPDLVAKTKVPDVLFRSHSAPLGLMFYTGTQFPADYRGGAFVALHGSWNAATPRGYKIVYVPFNNNRPSGEYVNFALGFWTTGQAPAGVMGRPVGARAGQGRKPSRCRRRRQRGVADLLRRQISRSVAQTKRLPVI